MFERSGGNWRQVANLTSTLTDAPRSAQLIGISGGTAVVGITGIGLHVYVRPPGGWVDMTETALLEGSGRATIAADTIVAAGFTTDDGSGLLLYQRPPSGWSSDQGSAAELTGSDLGDGNFFLPGVRFDGQTVVGERVTGGLSLGPVYVWEKPATGWMDATESAQLVGDGVPILRAAVDGDTIVGAAQDQVAPFATYLLVFDRPEDGWRSGMETERLELPSESQSVTLSFDGDTAVQGLVVFTALCAGDCNGARDVTVDEILMLVDIALGNVSLDSCP